MNPTINKEKEAKLREHVRQLKEYLDNGGKVTQISFGVSAYDKQVLSPVMKKSLLNLSA